MFTVALTYLGTAMAGHLLNTITPQTTEIYNRLAGNKTITNAEELVNLQYLKILKVISWTKSSIFHFSVIYLHACLQYLDQFECLTVL